jgi:photosystem II stability/assembly factor-like uncharacterized protein
MRNYPFRTVAGFTLMGFCGFALSFSTRAAAPAARIDYIAALPSECRDGCSLEVMDSKSGWLVGTAHDLLWETHDGGLSWKESPAPHLRPAESPKIGFVSGREGVMFTAKELYETSDGGAHWNVTEFPKFDGVIQGAWALPRLGLAWAGGGAFQPTDNSDGPNWAVKKYESGKWGILHPAVYARKTNGLWVKDEMPSCDLSIFSLKFWDEMRGFAVGDGCFYYTETSGDRWDVGVFHTGSEALNLYPYEGDEPPALKQPTFSFADQNNGWVSLEDNLLYRTRNGGKDWYRVVTAGAPYFNNLQFLNPAHGLGVARGKELYESVDGGGTWGRVKTESLPRSVYCLHEGHCWMLSDTGLYRISWN